MKELLIMGVFDRFTGGDSGEKKDEQGNTIQDYEEMLEEYRDAEAEILLNIAIIHFEEENIPESIKNLKEAIELYKGLDNAEKQALVLDIMGDINRYRDRPSDSLDNYREAYDLYSQINSDAAADVKDKISEVENIKYADAAQQKYDYSINAKPKHQKVVEVSEVDKKSEYSKIESNIEDVLGMLEGADTYKSYADAENPIEELEKAYDMSSGIGDTLGEASILLVMGDVYLKESKIDKALKNFDKALELFEEIDNDTGEAVSNLLIGTAYYMMGDTDSARTNFRRSVELLREKKDLLGEEYAMNLMNAIYVEE